MTEVGTFMLCQITYKLLSIFKFQEYLASNFGFVRITFFRDFFFFFLNILPQLNCYNYWNNDFKNDKSLISARFCIFETIYISK